MTADAPAFRQRRVISETTWGWVVAASICGDANAALTLSNTRSPFLIKLSMPPMLFIASRRVSTLLLPRMMLILDPRSGMEKSGRRRSAWFSFERPGPLESWNQKPAAPAATIETPALAARVINWRLVRSFLSGSIVINHLVDEFQNMSSNAGRFYKLNIEHRIRRSLRSAFLFIQFFSVVEKLVSKI